MNDSAWVPSPEEEIALPCDDPLGVPASAYLALARRRGKARHRLDQCTLYAGSEPPLRLTLRTRPGSARENAH